MLRRRIRTHASILTNALRELCLKYANQPRNVALTQSMMVFRLWPFVRGVFCRMLSRSLF